MRYFLVSFAILEYSGSIHFEFRGFPSLVWLKEQIIKFHEEEYPSQSISNSDVYVTGIYEFTESDFFSYISNNYA